MRLPANAGTPVSTLPPIPPYQVPRTPLRDKVWQAVVGSYLILGLYGTSGAFVAKGGFAHLPTPLGWFLVGLPATLAMLLMGGKPAERLKRLTWRQRVAALFSVPLLSVLLGYSLDRGVSRAMEPW